MNEPITQEQAKELWNQMDAGEQSPANPEPQQIEEVASEPVDTAQAVPQEPEEDPYEGLNPRVRDELVGLKEMVTQLTGRVRNTEGHIGGLKSQLQSQVEAAKNVRASGGDAPSAQQIANAQGDPAAFEQLKSDYPEFAEAISSYVKHQIGDRPTQDVAGKQEIERLRAEFSAALDAERRKMQVEIKHPNWGRLIQSPEFTGWYQQQQPEIRNLGASSEPADAIRMLDLFAESRRRAGSQNQRLMSAAALPTGRGNPVRVKPVEEMTKEEFWRYQDELEAHKR